MRKIDKIIVHCSDALVSTTEDIRRWHKEKGWSDIGYHFVIEKDGKIHNGRDLDIFGSHCVGQNTDSIGICICGKDLRDMNIGQFVSLRELIQSIKTVFGPMDVYGHRTLDKQGKTCPNFDVNKLHELIANNAIYVAENWEIQSKKTE